MKMIKKNLKIEIIGKSKMHISPNLKIKIAGIAKNLVIQFINALLLIQTEKNTYWHQ